jgi:hypothetical protein
VARGCPSAICGGAALFAVAIAGCYTGVEGAADTAADAGAALDGGESGDSDGVEDPDAPPEAPTDSVPVQTVPGDLATVTAEGFCVSAAAGQALVGVSPDGFAWLAETMPGDGATRFAVVDPWSEAVTAAPVDLALGTMVSIQPRSADDAIVVAADALWHVDAWSRVSLVPPEGWAGSASACGNPRDNGFVLTGGTLYEHRPDAWWGLTPEAHEGGSPDRIIAFDGECTGPADETWMSAPDGTIWRVSIEGEVRGLRFAELTAAAATGSTLAVLADGELWLGPEEWTRWDFEAGQPGTIAASGDQVFIAVGDRVLRAVGDEFTELSAPDALGGGEIEALLAHPGGLWIRRAGELCHAAIGPQLRIADVHPYQRTPERELSFSVASSDADAAVDATLDGEPLTLTPGAIAGELTGVLSLGGLGWHRLELQAAGTDSTATPRTLWLRHDVPAEVSFAADVAPIAAEHCSGGSCHSAMTDAGVPVLETLEAWAQHVEKIEERVVELDNMPPIGVRAESWGSDEVEMIAKWIEGGMLP